MHIIYGLQLCCLGAPAAFYLLHNEDLVKMLDVHYNSEAIELHVWAGQLLGSDSGAEGHSCAHA